MRRQTYGCLPSRKASLPIGWYQIILLGERGTRVLTTCLGLHSTVERLGFEPATYWSQVQHLTAMPLSHTLPTISCGASMVDFTFTFTIHQHQTAAVSETKQQSNATENALWRRQANQYITLQSFLKQSRRWQPMWFTLVFGHLCMHLCSTTVNTHNVTANDLKHGVTDNYLLLNFKVEQTTPYCATCFFQN